MQNTKHTETIRMLLNRNQHFNETRPELVGEQTASSTPRVKSSTHYTQIVQLLRHLPKVQTILI